MEHFVFEYFARYTVKSPICPSYSRIIWVSARMKRVSGKKFRGLFLGAAWQKSGWQDNVMIHWMLLRVPGDIGIGFL